MGNRADAATTKRRTRGATKEVARGFLKSILALVSLTISTSGGCLMAQSAPVKNVVLVHGAFADGSSWSKVIPLLQARGFHVASVGIPLTSFADDVAATKRHRCRRRSRAPGRPFLWRCRDHRGRKQPQGGWSGLRRRVRPGCKPNHHRDQQAFPTASRCHKGEAADGRIHPSDS